MSHGWDFDGSLQPGGQRLSRCFAQAVKGVIAASLTAAVLQSRDPQRTFHVAKRFYRWLKNPRLHHSDLLKLEKPQDAHRPPLSGWKNWSLWERDRLG